MSTAPALLAGKVALVTGGSKGLGRYIALDLAGAGAAVAVVSRHRAEAQAVAEEIRRSGARAMGIDADLTRVESLETMAVQVEDALGPVDILINNAGTNVRKPAMDFTEQEWDRVLDTNLRGTFFCSQALGRRMAARGGGTIVNVASAAGGTPVPWLAPYSVSKAGMIQLTRALALEWARHGIRVNAIAPSYVETPLTAPWLADPARRALIANRSPLRRIGRPSDLTGALLLFASDQSGFITGQTLFIDGGSNAGWVVDWDAIASSSSPETDGTP